jgi:hypothetical protein
VADGEDGPVRKAAGILADDLAVRFGRRPEVRIGRPDGRGPALWIASADNPAARPLLRHFGAPVRAVAGRWECYGFHTGPGRVAVIFGADGLATLRAVYGFMRDILGVDPMCRWTGLRPPRADRLTVRGLDRIVPSPTFRFRGWFLNAPRLIEWNLGRGPVLPPAHYRGLEGQGALMGALGPDLAAMIYETALRADMNLIIPLSYLNIFEPAERANAELAQEWGLFLSQHHQEPVGALLSYWDAFWRRRGQKPPLRSFVANPAAFETWWESYIREWARLPRVVWVLGHRGPGDRPFWLKDPHCPATDLARGRAISRAMAMQLRLIRKAQGRRPAYYCATLWQEGAPLHAAGTLTFPAGTMVVMADHGAKQLMREDFYKVPRRPELRYGVYYHVCYGPGGPIWAQGNNPDRMGLALQQVVQKGDTALALLNVGNIRPYHPGLACWSRLTTDAASFDSERFLREWCSARFGEALADEVQECYNAFFHAYITPSYRGYDGLRGFWDGVLSSEIRHLGRLLHSGDPVRAYRGMNWPSTDARVYLLFQRNKAAASEGAWESVCRRAHALGRRLRGPARNLFEENVEIQAELMLALTRGLRETAAAAIALADRHPRAAARCLAAARRAVRHGWDYAIRRGNRGLFQGWFADDAIGDYDLPRMLGCLERRLSDQTLPPSDRRWLRRLFEDE